MRGFACSTRTSSTYLYVDVGRIGPRRRQALLDHAKTRRPDGFTLWSSSRTRAPAGSTSAHGLVAVEFTDGEGNEEKTPDVRYEWKPSASRRPVALDRAAPELGELARPRARGARSRLRLLRGGGCDRPHRPARSRRRGGAPSSAISTPTSSGADYPSSILLTAEWHRRSTDELADALRRARRRRAAGGRRGAPDRGSGRAAGRLLHPAARRPRHLRDLRGRRPRRAVRRTQPGARAPGRARGRSRPLMELP